MGIQGVTPSAPPAPPAQLKSSVRKLAYTAIIASGAQSLSLNIYHDTHHGNLPGIIAVMAGIIAPFLCAVLAHVAAEMNFPWYSKACVFLVVGAMMYVSAASGISVLEHVMPVSPAAALSIGADAASMLCLGVLMEDSNRRAALEKWNQAEAERQKQAELEKLSARHARPQRRETPTGNAGGNIAENAWGNVLASAGGNTWPDTSGTTEPTASVTESPARQGASADATVLNLAAHRPATRRPAARRQPMTEEEIRKLAEAMAADLAALGEELTVRKFTAKYGGKTGRVGPIVNEVKTSFAAARKNAGAGPASADAR